MKRRKRKPMKLEGKGHDWRQRPGRSYARTTGQGAAQARQKCQNTPSQPLIPWIPAG